MALAPGVAVIFAGYLQTRRPDRALMPTVASAVPGFLGPHPSFPTPGGIRESATARGAPVSLSAIRGGRRPATTTDDPAIAFLESHFLTLNDAALAEAVQVWSVERTEVERFDRTQAQRVWEVRLRLSPGGQTAFDALSVSAKLQLTELYHEVLAPGVTKLAEERRSAHGG